MNPQPLAPYRKPWLTIDQQIRLLRERGLVIGDEAGAGEFLAHFNYYRFSGYALPFQHPAADGGRAFNPGTRFEDVTAVYFFDRALRDLFGEASEIIELDVRTSVAYLFGQTYGAFGHTRPENFMQGFRGKNKAGNAAKPVFDHPGAGWKRRDPRPCGRRTCSLNITRAPIRVSRTSRFGC